MSDDRQPDDDLPLTRELLLERCGFVEDEDCDRRLWSRMACTLLRIGVLDMRDWNADYDHIYDISDPPRTLGDLRKLAAGLGIPLERER